MATRTIANGGGNWNTASTWVENAVPTSADDVVATSTSGNLTIDALAASCNTINFTNYTATCTHNTNITLTVSGATCTFVSGMTYSPASGAAITISGAGANFTGGGKTFVNLNLTGAAGPTINDANTYTNLTRTGISNKTNRLQLGANQTITGTLTVNGNSTVNRVLINSSTNGTSRTVTAAAVSFSNVDFTDITAAGAANWNLAAITGNSGDAGGNSGITFTTAADQHWTSATGTNWSTAASWTSRVPLPQDNVFMDKAFNASQTVTGDMPRLGKNVDWTSATGSPAWNLTTAVTVFGSLTLISTMSFTGAQQFLFGGRASSHTLTSAGRTFPERTTFNGGGTYTLQDNLSVTSSCTLQSGGLIATTQNVTATTLVSNTSNTRTLTMGSGTWTLSGTGTVVDIAATSTGLTFSGASSTISITDTSSSTKTFNMGGQTYGTVSVSGGGSGSLTFNYSGSDSTVQTMTIGGPKTVLLLATTTDTLSIGTLTINGSAGNTDTFSSDTAASIRNVKITGSATAHYTTFQDINANPGISILATDNCTNGGNNHNIIFSVSKLLALTGVG